MIAQTSNNVGWIVEQVKTMGRTQYVTVRNCGMREKLCDDEMTINEHDVGYCYLLIDPPQNNVKLGRWIRPTIEMTSFISGSLPPMIFAWKVVQSIVSANGAL